MKKPKELKELKGLQEQKSRAKKTKTMTRRTPSETNSAPHSSESTAPTLKIPQSILRCTDTFTATDVSFFSYVSLADDLLLVYSKQLAARKIEVEKTSTPRGYPYYIVDAPEIKTSMRAERLVDYLREMFPRAKTPKPDQPKADDSEVV